MDNPIAMEACWKEWDNLENKRVFRYETLTEWSEVSRAAIAADQEIHFGFLFGFMVEKGAEFEPGDPRRKFKYRIVFRGNDVKDQNWEVALFQEMASTPTTLEAARYCDFVACLPGNGVDGRDVEQAYLQADMKGAKTYIQLPKEMWTPEMHQMKCPVVLLEKALYGHKNSGAYWQDFYDKQCKNAGLLPFSENWPCVYWNSGLELMLIVYVDDMKMAGPKKNMAKAWEDLGKGIHLVKPAGDTDGVHNFLGCEHKKEDRIINGKEVTTMTWDASHS